MAKKQSPSKTSQASKPMPAAPKQNKSPAPVLSQAGTKGKAAPRGKK